MNHLLFYSKSEAIELLKYYFFLESSYFLILSKTEKTLLKNIQIKEFLETLQLQKDQQLDRIEFYLTSLYDSIYWQSKDIYLEGMENFVAGKYNSREFVDSIFYQLIADKHQSLLLQKDFEMQEKLELNLEISKFSLVMQNLERVLEPFYQQMDLEPTYLNEDELRDIVKQHLSYIHKYFINPDF